MTLYVIPKRLQRVWDICNIRGSVLASLSLQILLIFLAPSRKRTRGNLITIILWSAYLLADFVAAYAIGLITNNQGDECDKSNVNNALSAFWAPFLLLHLGGPDSITAFALEDNELWVRHLFTLMAEVIMVAYVFTQAAPFPLWLPTVLVYLAGVIKYAERTRALYLACLDNLNKDSMTRDTGSSIPEASPEARLDNLNTDTMTRDTGSSSQEAPTKPTKRTLKEIDVVQYGFHCYKVFRKLIIDHMLNMFELRDSKEFFRELKAPDAFGIMEVELNFIYDALYTKLATVHESYLWYIFRFICTALIAASLFLFKSHHKPHIHPLDISITYSLLIGAIILDLVASIKLVFSDWTVALLKSEKALNLIYTKKALNLIYTIHKRISFRGRWSNSMGQHNLVSFCLKKRRFKLLVKVVANKVVGFFGFDEIFMYEEFIPVEDDLKRFIFSVIEEKAEAFRPNDNNSSWAHLTLKKHGVLSSPIIKEAVDGKIREIEDSVLMWHIATDILYHTYDPDNSSNNHQNLPEISSSSTDPEEARHFSDEDYKRFCKILSDYMLYLIVLQPSLISAVSATSLTSFRNTCEIAKQCFNSSQEDGRDARIELLSNFPTFRGLDKSDLDETFELVTELKDRLHARVWKMVSELWVELLCYGASESKGRPHAQQLSKGGELVTIVWLLMAHFGIVRDTYRERKKQQRPVESFVPA